jgi:translation initiation factor 3 subunit M
MLLVSPDQLDSIVTLFCEKIGQAETMAPLRLKLLNTLLQALGPLSQHSGTVYSALLGLATSAGLLHVMNPRLEEVEALAISVARKQSLLRQLYETTAAEGHTESANKVLVALLGTFTDETASSGRQEALRAIVASIADPGTLLLDHLLTLKPVKVLEGELIHDLLLVFVTGTLPQYLNFYNKNKDFIASLGLDHNNNLQKMRILTFMSMAQGHNEISFDTVSQNLNIPKEDVEAFVIDVVRTKMMHAKIDHLNQRVLVSSVIPACFSRPQWQRLHEELTNWKHNLNQVLVNLRMTTQPPAMPVPPPAAMPPQAVQTPPPMMMRPPMPRV